MSDMVFHDIGGAWHLEIEAEEILARIHELNPARWAVTSVPIVDLTCDAGFIAFMDREKKGRILVDRVIESRDWMFKNLKGRGKLAAKVEELKLDDVDTSHADGEGLRKAAERILREKGASDSSTITLKQVRDYRAGYAKLLANGDGVLCPETVPEAEVAAFVKDIMATVGSVTEFSGNAGAGLAELDKFLAQGAAYTAWKARGAGADGLPNVEVHPWADATAGAAERVKDLDAKLEQYFAQCDLVKEDPTQAAKFRAALVALDNMQVLEPAAISAALTAVPISEPRADGTLPFDAKMNPAYEAKFSALREHVLTRALGRDATQLTRDTWRAARGTFAPYWAWMSAKPPEPFDAIAGKLAGYLSGPLADRYRHFCGIDTAAAPEVAMLANLEKLILFQRWLLEFTNNFVNLSALYDPRVRTIFEMGTLVIDSRRLEFTIRVVNRAEHKKVATESRIFLAYLAVFDDPTKPALYEIAAPVTKGERGRLIPGKRGVFYANDGKVYDAVVLEIIEHPISIPEAIKAPFRRTAEFISKKIEEFAASRAAAAEARAQANLTKAAIEMNKPPAPAEAAKKTDPAATAGIAASLGIAVAAMGSAMAFIISSLAKITFLDAVLAIISIIGFIALFAGFLGWLKLRMRNLAPLFEANGWAVNPRMKVNGRVARIFTRHPGLPRGHVKRIRPTTAVDMIDDEDDSFQWKLFFNVSIIGIAIAYIVSAIYFHELIIAITPGK